MNSQHNGSSAGDKKVPYRHHCFHAPGLNGQLQLASKKGGGAGLHHRGCAECFDLKCGAGACEY